jgi:hypothetical protein
MAELPTKCRKSVLRWCAVACPAGMTTMAYLT